MRMQTPFVLLGIMAGCSAEVSPIEASRPATTEDMSANADIALLRELQLFDVTGPVDPVPAGANCYSLPCETSAARLSYFTETAVKAAAQPPAEDVPESATAQHLEFLRHLDVVTIGDLIIEQPKNSYICYGLPCPADIEAAAAVNGRRRGQIANIVGTF